MQAEWFEDFAKQVLEEKGVAAPDEAVEKQLIRDISVATRDVVLRDLIDALSEEEMQHLEAAIDNNDEAAAQKVMSDKQPIVTAALQRVRMKYIGA